jgi:hypothetical protein
MKTIFRPLSILAVLSIFLISGCGDDDDEPNVDPLVGVYSLNSVILNEDVTYFGMELKADDDITNLVSTALYVASPCASGPNTVIDLRDDFEIYYACKNESVTPERFGSWTINTSRDRLTLNLIIEGNAFPLILDQLVVSDTGVSGVITNYPLVEIIPGSAPVIKTVNVTIDFNRTTL